MIMNTAVFMNSWGEQKKISENTKNIIDLHQESEKN